MSGMIADLMPGHWQWPSTLLLAVANILLIFTGCLRLTEMIFRLTEIDSKVLLILDFAWLGLTHINGDENACSILLSTSWGFDSPWERAFFAAMIVKAHCCFFFFPVLVSTERTLKRKYRAPKFLNGYQCNNSILVPNGDNYSVEETFDKVMVSFFQPPLWWIFLDNQVDLLILHQNLQ